MGRWTLYCILSCFNIASRLLNFFLSHIIDKFILVHFSLNLIDNLKFVFVSGLPSCALKTLSDFTSERVFFIACLLLSEYSFERLYHIANYEHDPCDAWRHKPCLTGILLTNLLRG